MRRIGPRPSGSWRRCKFRSHKAFPYMLHGFTYNLQDLVTLPYFGAPATTSVNHWFSFQGNSSLFVCSNGS